MKGVLRLLPKRNRPAVRSAQAGRCCLPVSGNECAYRATAPLRLPARDVIRCDSVGSVPTTASLDGARHVSASTAKPSGRAAAETEIADWIIESNEMAGYRKKKSRATDVLSDACLHRSGRRHAEACERRTTIGTRLPRNSV